MKQWSTTTSLLCCLALGCSADAQAVDFSVSTFGTLGGAISDNDITYQRYINDSGTLVRDSLAGVQLDAKINEQWAATAQLVLAPAMDNDGVLEPQFKWTLLSYRPADDWLIRVGRLSLGGLLNQQNMDVGVTYDMARLPSEVYLISAAYDYDGLSLAKTWSTDAYEITLDGSLGMQNRDYRSYYNASDRPIYYSADITAGGLVVTITDYGQSMLRGGWHLSEIDPDDSDDILSEYTFVPLGGGLYTLGRPIFKSSTLVNTLFLGARLPLAGFLVTCEGTAILAQDFEAGPPTIAAYVNLSRKVGDWTPYITYAQTWTDGIDTWRRVRGATPVPQIGVTQTLIDNTASAIAVYEQNSWMLGTSYAITPKQKIKAEAMLTHVGERSAMFDGEIAHDNVMVYSLSYNFAF